MIEHLRAYGRKKIDALLLTRGYRIAPYRVFDLRDSFRDPRQFHYYGGHPVLVTLPAISGRCGHFTVDSGISPYRRAFLASRVEEKDFFSTTCEELEAYRSLFCAETVVDLYGRDESNMPIDSSIKLPAPLPWKRYSPREFSQYKKKLRARFDRQLHRPDGDTIEAEARRFVGLARSIEKNGYKRNDSPDGDISVTVLFKEDGSWSWITEAGNHRAMALGALGYREFPARIEAIVYRRDAAIWPNVINGTYSRDYASQVFDRIFDGVPSPALAQWIERIGAC